MSDEPMEHATGQPPIATANGRAFIPADAVVTLLRDIAEACRNFADDPDCDLRTIAAAIDIEADTLDRRASEHTR